MLLLLPLLEIVEMLADDNTVSNADVAAGAGADAFIASMATSARKSSEEKPALLREHWAVPYSSSEAVLIMGRVVVLRGASMRACIALILELQQSLLLSSWWFCG